MRTTIIVAAALAGVSASSVPRTEPDFSAERLRAHVTFLADDLLEGREAGTRGHEIAAGYIASQFALLGLKPGGENGSYFQTVQIHEGAPTEPSATLTVAAASGTHRFEHGRNAVIFGPTAGGVVRLQSALVFVGYGVTDASLGYDDYAGLDVRGKIVVALRDSPKALDSEISAHLQRQQSRTAAEHGASAIIFVQTRERARTVPFERVVQGARAPLTTWVRKDGTAQDRRYGLKASGTIDPQGAAALFEGAERTWKEVLDEAEGPLARPKGFPLRSTAELTAATGMIRRYSSPEVIGIIEGAHPELKAEYVAVMAHADHIGVRPGASGDRINNGALDNAVGIATLLEIARAFTTAAARPRRSIVVVAHTAEEKGQLGAEYFGNHPPVPIGQLNAAINIDMPVLLYDFRDVVVDGASHSTLGEVVRTVGERMDVQVVPDPTPEQGSLVRSDHYAMVQVGIPAVRLSPGPANGGDAAWVKFNRSNYHQPSDDLSQPILWSAGAKFAELNYRVLREVTDSNTRPRWYVGDYFGDLFAPTAPKVPKPSAP